MLGRCCGTCQDGMSDRWVPARGVASVVRPDNLIIGAWWKPIAWSLLLITLAAAPPDRLDRAHPPASPRDPGQRRPNVLILIGDDHTAGSLGIDGDKHQVTPRLDALARQGVRFDRAFSNAPLCPSRRKTVIT